MPELISRCFFSLPCSDFCSTMRSTSSVSLPLEHSAEDASVAGGIVGLGSENRHGGIVCRVKVAHSGNGLRCDERNIAGQHQHVPKALQRLARLHDGVSGAALFALQYKADSGRCESCPNLLRLMPDDGKNVLRRAPPAWPPPRHAPAAACRRSRAALWDAATSGACLCRRRGWRSRNADNFAEDFLGIG